MCAAGAGAAQAGAALGLDEEAKGGQVAASKLRAAVDAVLADPKFAGNARRLGQSLHAAGGTVVAVDHIERIIAEHKAGTTRKRGILAIKHPA